MAFTVPWYSTLGVRPAVSVPIGRLRASTRAFQADGVHAPSPQSCATLPCRHSDPSLKDCALAVIATGASSCRLRLAVSSIIRSAIVEFQTLSTNDPLPERCRLVGGGERIQLERVFGRRAVEHGVELRQLVLIDGQPRDGDVGVRCALAPPVDVHVGGELVQLHVAVLDIRALRIELDERRARGTRDPAAGMQRAARIFGQQAKVVGVDAERRDRACGWDRDCRRWPARWCPRAAAPTRRSSPRPV